MNRLSETLSRAIGHRKLREIEEVTGIPAASLSRIANGLQFPGRELLERLLMAFERPVQNALVDAYLLDLTPDSQRSRVDRLLAAQPPAETVADLRVRELPGLPEHLQALHRHAQADENTAELLRLLAAVVPR